MYTTFMEVTRPPLLDGRLRIVLFMALDERSIPQAENIFKTTRTHDRTRLFLLKHAKPEYLHTPTLLGLYRYTSISSLPRNLSRPWICPLIADPAKNGICMGGKLSQHVGEGKGDVCRAAVRALRA